MRRSWPWLRAALPCLSCALLAAKSITLIELHGPEGQRFYLNPAEISTIREPNKTDLVHHFAAGTRCIIVATNGKFLAVRETCDAVRAAVSPSP